MVRGRLPTLNVATNDPSQVLPATNDPFSGEDEPFGITKPNLVDYYYEPTHPFNSSLCICLSQSICVHWIIIIESIHNI